MARRVQEGDGLAVHLHLIGADVLGDAAGLSGRHRGVADGIQQGGLAVVHVTHDHHHGSPGHQILRLVLVVVNQPLLDGDDNLLLHLAAHLLGDDGGGVEVNDLAEGGHNAVLHQALDHLCAGFLHAAGQFAHGDLIGDHDLHRGLLGDLQLEPAHPLCLVLLALVGEGHAAPALVVGADLLLAAALLPLHPSAPLAAQILQPLIILGQIHVAALAGVHDLPLGHPGHRLLRRRLGGGVLLLGLLPATLAALRALGRHRLPDLLALGGRGGLAGGLWLFGGWFLRRLLLVGVGEDHLDAGDRIVLRQVFKDQRELLICQRLHVVFGSLGVFRQDLRDGLGGKAEILRHLMDSVFLNTQ